MNFDIKTEQLGDDAYVISLAGEVDLYPAGVQAAAPGRDLQGGQNVIVDFTNTTFIDSTTLGVLVGGVKRLRTNDSQLSVCSDRNITKIFEITGLDRVFTIHATRDEAVEQLQARPRPAENAAHLPRAMPPSCSRGVAPVVWRTRRLRARQGLSRRSAELPRARRRRHARDDRPLAGRRVRGSAKRGRRVVDPRGHPRANALPIAPMPEPDSPQCSRRASGPT